MFCSDATHFLLGEASSSQLAELRFSDAALVLISRLSKEIKQPMHATRELLARSMVDALCARAFVPLEGCITGVDHTVCWEDGVPAAVFSIDFAGFVTPDVTGEATLRFDVDVLRHGMA